MTINWLLIGVLFCICLPGVGVAIPRLIRFLLPNNTTAVQKRFSNLAVAQTLVLVLVLCVAGVVLSPRTGLHAYIIEAALQGQWNYHALITFLLPSLLFSLCGLLVFLLIYYWIMPHFVDAGTIKVMGEMRASIGLAGAILYGGVTEEVIARWGIMSLSVFFIIIFMEPSPVVYGAAILISATLFAVGQIPAYQAAGCVVSRPFLYSLVLLSVTQSVVYGVLFWQYGLESAILGHVLFHLGWGACLPDR